MPGVKYSFTEILRPCMLPTSFQTVDILSKKFIMSSKMTSHKDIVTMVSICRWTPAALLVLWVGCSGLKVNRKYGCVAKNITLFKKDLGG